ncbi:MAG: reverse transcriptase family protein [Saprospiraceae bacterium]
MPAPPSRLELRAKHDAFLRLHSVTGLCELLDEDPLRVLRVSEQPEYREFKVPKKNGELRLIEDPAPELKSVLRQLNECLQAVYYFYKSPAAFGFLTGCSDDPPELQRSIVGNARQHMGQAWMLNMDLEDFFHAVEDEQIAAIFLGEPFGFPAELARTLTLLCCYKGRLAMGAPTSPVLSNFAARRLDADLCALAEKRGWRYTRYADDMTFSTNKEAISEDDIALLKGYFEAHGFANNESKTKLMGPDVPHVVTGIVVGDNHLDLKDEFFSDLQREIRQYDELRQVKGRLGISLLDWVEDYDDRIRGMMEFARQVVGQNDPRLRHLTRELHEAHQRKVVYAAFSWLDFPYPS